MIYLQQHIISVKYDISNTCIIRIVFHAWLPHHWTKGKVLWVAMI